MMSNYFRLAIICFSILIIGCNQVENKYKEAEAINTIEAFQKFIQDYPDHRFTELARSKVDSLAFMKAKSADTEESYTDYLGSFPNGKFTDEARSRAELIAFEAALQENVESAYLEFLSKFPGGDYELEAREKAADLRFEQTLKEYTVIGFEKFISDYPESDLIIESRKNIDDIKNGRYSATEETFISYQRLKEVFNWNGSFNSYVVKGDGVMETKEKGNKLYGNWCVGNIVFPDGVLIQRTGIVLEKGAKMIYPPVKTDNKTK